MSLRVESQPDGITVLTIDRPAARNAISRELATALAKAIRVAGSDEQVRAVIIAAAGETVFAAGGDLKQFKTLPMTAEGADRVLAMGRELACFETCPVPIIAAVQGDVLGGGCELLMLCDLIVMEEQARFRWLHAKMGLVPAWGGATRLVERVGATLASELLLSAAPLGAARALALGLVNDVVPPGQALKKATELAGRIARNDRQAVAQLKRALLSVRQARRGDGLKREQDVFKDIWGGAPHRSAFSKI